LSILHKEVKSERRNLSAPNNRELFGNCVAHSAFKFTCHRHGEYVCGRLGETGETSI